MRGVVRFCRDPVLGQ